VDRAIKYATAIVLAHLVVNIVHGVAHRRLHVELDWAATFFVISVILLCPLIAIVLLWVSQERLGLILLTFSMAASFVFGFYNHFAVMSPDNVREQAPGPWGTAFVLTAYLLCVTEAVGAYWGFRLFFRRPKGIKSGGIS